MFTLALSLITLLFGFLTVTFYNLVDLRLAYKTLPRGFKIFLLVCEFMKKSKWKEKQKYVIQLFDPCSD